MKKTTLVLSMIFVLVLGDGNCLLCSCDRRGMSSVAQKEKGLIGFQYYTKAVSLVSAFLAEK